MDNSRRRNFRWNFASIQHVARAWRIVGRRLLLSKAIRRYKSHELTRTRYIYTHIRVFELPIKAILEDAHEKQR